MTVTADNPLKVIAGTESTYTVVLDNRPLRDVIITSRIRNFHHFIRTDPLAVASVSGPLVFTPDNWDQPQTVRVMGIKDKAYYDPEIDRLGFLRKVRIIHRIQGDNIAFRSLLVDVYDAPGVKVLLGANYLIRLREINDGIFLNGTFYRYRIKLSSEPMGDVTVTATSSNPTIAKVSAPLTFTPDNWRTVQWMTVTSVDDKMANANGKRLTTITHKVSGANYENIVVADVINVEVRDNGDRVPDNTQAHLKRLNKVVLPELSRAMVLGTLEAVSKRIELARPNNRGKASLSMAGQSNLYHLLGSITEPVDSPVGADTTDRRFKKLDLDKELGRSSFVLPLDGEGLKAQLHNLVTLADGKTGGEEALETLSESQLFLWGAGSFRSLSSEDEGSVDWEGDVVGVHLGIDTLVRPDFMVGLALSRWKGNFDYTDLTTEKIFKRTHETQMMNINPYMSWFPSKDVSLWGMFGYGWGELEISNPDQVRSDIGVKSLAIGGSDKLVSDNGLIVGGESTLWLGGEAFFVYTEVPGDNGLILPVSVETHLQRLTLEGRHEQALSGGNSSLAPSVELGFRHDGGDGMTGFGLEVGGGLEYVDRSRGLTVKGSGRTLATHESGRGEWGGDLSLHFEPGDRGRGALFDVLTAWGAEGSGVSQLWDDGMAGQPANDDEKPDMRFKIETGYGFAMRGDRGLLTPYGGVTLSGMGRKYNAGGRFEMDKTLDLSLEGTLRERERQVAEHNIELKVKLKW